MFALEYVVSKKIEIRNILVYPTKTKIVRLQLKLQIADRVKQKVTTEQMRAKKGFASSKYLEAGKVLS